MCSPGQNNAIAMSCTPSSDESTFPVIADSLGHAPCSTASDCESNALLSTAQPSLSSPNSCAKPSATSVAEQGPLPIRSQPKPSLAMMYNDRQSMQWATNNTLPFRVSGHHSMSCDDSIFAGSSAHGFPHNRIDSPYRENRGVVHSGQYSHYDLSHWYDDNDPSGLPNKFNTAESYPPSVYQIVPQTDFSATPVSEHGTNGNMMSINEDYDCVYDSGNWAYNQNGLLSPYSDMTRASTPHEDMSDHGHWHNDRAEVGKEEPYAQLIFKALRQAPGHTMILRDIYEWFKTNTDKATKSETKGWQNSIRHNLSMNGAFEKVDQPGEDSRKGYLWRLTSKALHEGVKSTTRYRSKQPSKRGSRKSAQLAKAKRTQRMPDHFTSEPRPQLPMSAQYDHTASNATTSYLYHTPHYPGFKSEEGEPIKSEQHEEYSDYHVDTANSLDMLSNPLQFGGVSMAQNSFAMGSYYPQAGGESSYRDSPSPTISEPLTPPSADLWYEGFKTEGGAQFDEIMFPEHGC